MSHLYANKLYTSYEYLIRLRKVLTFDHQCSPDHDNGFKKRIARQKPTNNCVIQSLQARNLIFLDHINNLCDF